MDVFEHAFMIDYGLKRADYITAFFNNINWQAVEARIRSLAELPALVAGSRQPVA
jgi:superoxide dismutase